MIESEGRLKTFAVDDDRVSKAVDQICDQLGFKPYMLRVRENDYRYWFNAHQMTQWAKRLHARDKLA
jgi:hypothetical protein